MKETRILQFKRLRDGRTDQRTDKASYRVASPRPKSEMKSKIVIKCLKDRELLT